jgi:hypothetical protein
LISTNKKVFGTTINIGHWLVGIQEQNIAWAKDRLDVIYITIRGQKNVKSLVIIDTIQNVRGQLFDVRRAIKPTRLYELFTSRLLLVQLLNFSDERRLGPIGVEEDGVSDREAVVSMNGGYIDGSIVRETFFLFQNRAEPFELFLDVTRRRRRRR